MFKPAKVPTLGMLRETRELECLLSAVHSGSVQRESGAEGRDLVMLSWGGV